MPSIKILSSWEVGWSNVRVRSFLMSGVQIEWNFETFNFFHTPTQNCQNISYPYIFLQNISYLIGQKFVGQKCRNFSLVSKILSDERFCPSKILSNISIQKSGKNRTKLSKFGLGVENFVRRNILSDESFVRRNFVR